MANRKLVQTSQGVNQVNNSFLYKSSVKYDFHLFLNRVCFFFFQRRYTVPERTHTVVRRSMMLYEPHYYKMLSLTLLLLMKVSGKERGKKTWFFGCELRFDFRDNNNTFSRLFCRGVRGCTLRTTTDPIAFWFWVEFSRAQQLGRKYRQKESSLSFFYYSLIFFLLLLPP